MKFLGNLSLNLLVALIALVFVFPYIWMVISSFKTPADIIAIPPKLIFRPTIENFQRLITDFHVVPAIWNSVIVVSMATTLAVILGVMAAYAMARFEFKGKNALALDILSIRMI